MNGQYDVFISYRRDGGFEMALLLYEKLRNRGYRAFIDIEALKNGKFNEKLYDTIDGCTDFILVLSPGALDRCVNEDDWVRREILRAMEQGKNIVPVEMPEFQEPADLPAQMQDLLKYNRVLPTQALFNEAVDKMCRDFLHSKRTRTGLLKGISRKDTPSRGQVYARYQNMRTFCLMLFLVAMVLFLVSFPERDLSGFDPEHPDLTTFSGICDYVESRSRNTSLLPEPLGAFQALLRNAMLHYWAKIVCLGMIASDLFLTLIGANMPEILESEYTGRSFDVSVFSDTVDAFIAKLLELPDCSLLPEMDDPETEERIPDEKFARVVRLCNLAAASEDGERLDYLCWEPNGDYAFYQISQRSTLATITRQLVKGGFAFLRKESDPTTLRLHGDRLFFRKDDILCTVQRRHRLFWNTQIEMKRDTVGFSALDHAVKDAASDPAG